MSAYNPAPVGGIAPELASAIRSDDPKLITAVLRDQRAILEALLPGDAVTYITRTESSVKHALPSDATVIVTSRTLMVGVKGKIDTGWPRKQITSVGMVYEPSVRKYLALIKADRIHDAHIIGFEREDEAVALLTALGYEPE